MRLDVADAAWIDAGQSLGSGDDFDLAIDAGPSIWKGYGARRKAEGGKGERKRRDRGLGTGDLKCGKRLRSFPCSSFPFPPSALRLYPSALPLPPCLGADFRLGWVKVLPM